LKNDYKSLLSEPKNIIYDNCCAKNHVNLFSAIEKSEILDYFDSMQTNDQKNEHLKSVVLAIEILQSTVSDSRRAKHLNISSKQKLKTIQTFKSQQKFAKKLF